MKKKNATNMQDLIEIIKEEGLSLVDLAGKVQVHYTESKELQDELEPMFRKMYIDISERNKELEEIGEYVLSDKYYFTLGVNYDRFKETIERDYFGYSKDAEELERQTMMYNTVQLRSKQLYIMERSKYWYRAYKRVLEDNLGMLNYNYNKPKSEQL